MKSHDLRANTSIDGKQLDELWRSQKFNDEEQHEDEDELLRHGVSDVHVQFLEEQSAFLPAMDPLRVASVGQRISADLVSLKNWDKDLPLLHSCVLQAVAIWRTLRHRAARDSEAGQLLEAFERGSLALAATALQLTAYRAGTAPAPLRGEIQFRRQELRRLLKALQVGIEPSVEEFLQIFAKRWALRRQSGHGTRALLSGAMCSAQLALLSGKCPEATPRRLAQVHFMVSCHCLGEDFATARACCAYDEKLEEDFKQALRILLSAGNLMAKIAFPESETSRSVHQFAAL